MIRTYKVRFEIDVEANDKKEAIDLARKDIHKSIAISAEPFNLTNVRNYGGTCCCGWPLDNGGICGNSRCNAYLKE